MSLTAMEKARVRLYLGLADQFRYLDSRLESVLNNDLSPEGEILVQEALAALVLVETQMLGAPILNAGVKRVDEVWFFENGSNSALKGVCAAARPFISRISIITGVPIYGDAFGSGGWPGDTFSELGGMPSRSGRGGAIPLG